MSAILGTVLGLIIIFMTNQLEGDPVSALLKADAAMIVFGGTGAALLVHADWRAIVTAVKQIGWLVRPPSTDPIKLIKDVVEWAKQVRAANGSTNLLQDVADDENDLFIKVALEMIASGKKVKEVRDTLYQIGDVEDRENMQGGEIWEAAGGYAPTIGVLGAVMGLIHVMLRLDHPSGLGPGIATAFVATVYGVGSANLFFIPLGNRLKAIAGARTVYREIATEGLILLAQKSSPLVIGEKMENLLESRRRNGLRNDEAVEENTNATEQRAEAA